MLALITQGGAAPKDPLTVAARRRVVQQGFVEYFLMRSNSLGYKIEDDTTAVFDNMELTAIEDLYANLSISRMSPTYSLDVVSTIDKLTPSMSSANVFKGLENGAADDIERVTSGNKMVESTILLAANVTELSENHWLLLQ